MVEQYQLIIEDVKNCRSEIGILYLNDFNRKVLSKLFQEFGLEFHEIMKCHIYVYMAKSHPLARQKEVTLEELEEYPCLSFEQGTNNPFYFAEYLVRKGMRISTLGKKYLEEISRYRDKVLE